MASPSTSSWWTEHLVRSENSILVAAGHRQVQVHPFEKSSLLAIPAGGASVGPNQSKRLRSIPRTCVMLDKLIQLAVGPVYSDTLEVVLWKDILDHGDVRFVLLAPTNPTTKQIIYVYVDDLRFSTLTIERFKPNSNSCGRCTVS